ncbi:MAG: RNA polymerase sigma factor [Acidimicrobiales bacterium]
MRTVSERAEALAAAWPATARRVRGFLYARGVPAARIDDLCQEAAARVLAHQVPFADADDLTPWACTVAWRLYLGELRSTRRHVSEDVLRDQPSSARVEDEALGRLTLAEVVTVVSRMAERDQQILLAGFAPPDGIVVDPKDASRLAVKRHRARARLRRAVGTIGVLLVGAARRLRWPAAVAATAIAVGIVMTPEHGTTAPQRQVLEPRVQIVQASRPSPASVVASRRVSISRRSNPPPAPPPVRTVSHAPRIGVRRRARTAHDHLLCTGSLILLPDRCVG